MLLKGNGTLPLFGRFSRLDAGPADANNIRMHTRFKSSSKRKLSPPQIILIGFASLIVLGALLLMLPISSAAGVFTSFRTTLFTATSATCVTGLVVVDTGTYWSAFGKVVIITLIQIGGLGFMTLAVVMSMFLKRQLTPRDRVLVAQSLGLPGVGDATRLVKRIITGTVIIEGTGALILATQFIPVFGFGRGLLYGFFHSISAFCNAGFDILGGYGGEFCSFTCFADNYVIGFTLIALILLGGIGFIVWDDLVLLVTKKQPISLYSRFILIISAVLVFGGAALLMLTEWNNPATIGSLPVGDRLFHCLFQSVTTRTAGIDMIGNDKMTEASQLVSMFLMFIGGASGSTAGGVKMGTFGVVVLAILAFARGEDELVVMKRRVPHDTVIRALSIMGIDFTVALISTLIICSGGFGVIPAMYDAISAIATVGLSLSLTPKLSLAADLALIVSMYFGRVGILTFTYSILLRKAQKKSCITYPEINIMIG